MSRIACFALCILVAPLIAAEPRTYTSNDGKTLVAEFVGSQDEQILLKLPAGNIIKIPLSRLSEADQAYAKGQAAAEGKLANLLNEVVGQPMVSGISLEQRDAAELAKNLGLKLESDTKLGRSWRLYASFVKDYQLFGTIPYSIALYSDAEGHVRHLSVVFANKGDFGSTVGMGENHFVQTRPGTSGSLFVAMQKDEETIAAKLTKVLGPAKKQRFGETGTRRTVERWDWNNHSFLLSHVEGEYVGLAILRTTEADAEGRASRQSDTAVRAHLLSGITRKDNGDVFLSEIPMVDQGPKGYCVPATFERTLRTMGIDADMYLLAMMGQTTAQGGTVVELLLENLKSQVYRKGRRIKDIDFKNLNMREVAHYINQGIPIMWCMHSVEEFNLFANSHTQERAKVTDWSGHRSNVVKKANELISQTRPVENRHISLIIGYNEATHELAISDSWGKEYALRWVPMPVANWVSMGKLFVILP